MKTELLLREAFDGDDHGFEPAAVDVIRGRVASRRRRNRGALAAAVVALIVSVGLALGPMQSPEPSAVFVSDDTGPGETEPADGTDGATADDFSFSAALQTLDPLDTTVVQPLEGAGFDYRRPDLRTIVGDGDGGFVGTFFVGGVDPRGPATILSRSADGIEWDATARWEIGPRTVQEIRRSGDDWIAVLGGPTVGYVGPNENFFTTDPTLEIAMSSDLTTWTHFEAPFDLSRRAAAAEAVLEDVYVDPAVLGVGRHQGTLAVQVAWWISPVWELARGACGTGRDGRGVFVIGCDGAIDVVVDYDTLEALDLLAPELYLAEGDASLVLADDPPLWPMRMTSAGFVAIDDGLSTLQRTTDGVTWETIVDFAPPGPGEWQWALAADDGASGGSTAIVLGTSTDDPRTWAAAVNTETGDVEMRALPLNTDVRILDGFIDHGPAGWAAVVAVSEAAARPITQDEYAVVRWPDTTGGQVADFYMAPVRANLTDFYTIDPSNELVEMGLFGELRIRRPGTSELLIDGADWRDLETTVVRPSAAVEFIEAPFEDDGWTITGDPFYGPLVITDPDGGEQTFADGYAFTNASFEDGVELVGATADRANDPAAKASLGVFVDGALALSVPFVDLVETLDFTPDTDLDPAAEPGDAWVLRSDDGAVWEVVWTEKDAGFGSVPQIIVGDEEVLIRQWTVSGDVRSIPLPE